MSFKLFVLAGGAQHPEYNIDHDDSLKARRFVEEAIARGYLTREENSAFSDAKVAVLVKIGPGTVMRLIRDTEAVALGAEQRLRAAHLQHGLIGPAPAATKNYRVIIQAGVEQIDPDLEFDTYEEAFEVAERACAPSGHVCHTVSADSDFLYVIPSVGQVFMIMTKDDAEARRRMILEMRMRQQQKAPSKLLLPRS